MKNIKIVSAFLVFLMTLCVLSHAVELDLSSESACLMEISSGKVIYEKNADVRLEPASVTKVMSLLLVFEALDEGRIGLDTVISASEHACSMGGSQIWLETGETMTVDEMLKAVVVASANDCTVALGELISGSEESFVASMNERAKELGLANTHFENCTGLPAPNHFTTARDIAVMTRELYKHKKIFDYTGIWMDTLRGGEFGITNTNKLVRFYNGATGMKTGFTSSALYCMSATAKREDMNLVAVVMKAESSDKRFADARKLLDYGFANYGIYKPEEVEFDEIPVKSGVKKTVKLKSTACELLVEKGKKDKVERNIALEESLDAPVKNGDVVGKVVYCVDGKEIASFPVVCAESVEKISFFGLFSRILSSSVTIR